MQNESLLCKSFKLINFIITILLLIVSIILIVIMDYKRIDGIHLVNIALDVMGLFISIILSFTILKLVSIDNKATPIFMAMIFINSFALLYDEVAWIVQGVSEFSYINLIDNFLFYLSGPSCLLLFYFYIKLSLKRENKKIFKYMDYFVIGLYILEFIALVLNFFFGFYFTIDFATGIYSRGEFYLIGNLPYALIFIAIIIEILASKGTKHEKIMFLLYIFSMTISFLLQTFIFGLSIIYPISILVMYFIFCDMQIINNKKYLETESKFLASQIKPHFIQNCLANIKGLMYSNPDEAEQMILDLSSYLRDVFMFIDVKNYINFSEELEFSEFYINLEKRRYPNCFEIEKNINIDCFKLAPFTIEPIVENALAHGVRGKRDGIVKIETNDLDKFVEIVVSDNGRGFDTSKEYGVGLSNVKNRITLSKGKFEISSSDSGTVVRIILPKVVI